MIQKPTDRRETKKKRGRECNRPLRGRTTSRVRSQLVWVYQRIPCYNDLLYSALHTVWNDEEFKSKDAVQRVPLTSTNRYDPMSVTGHILQDGTQRVIRV